VARKPLVCHAAAAEAEVVEATSSSQAKAGVAHLRFKRGSAFKVCLRAAGVCGGRATTDAAGGAAVLGACGRGA
jgi:hypothetical protein